MLRGNLAEFPLVGILQLISSDHKTGTVRILENHAGAIGVQHGRIVDAVYHPSSGERALSLLNSLPSAPFQFDSSAAPTETTITRRTETLLLELHDAPSLAETARTPQGLEPRPAMAGTPREVPHRRASPDRGTD
ncbi:MAG: DUF4388 domain-containing protein [Pleurocapsa sp. SU_196_0]|nr:DUF4388 domain-containing protein [Pleurocapsa sp. SU_196_0]